MKITTNEYGVKFEIPEANNQQSAKVNFHERKSLDELIHREGLTDFTVDMRIQNSLYGRVDYDNNAIYPDGSKVEFEPNSEVFGFDFINEAIREFNEDWESLLFKLPQTSPYKSIQTMNRNYRNIEETFRNYHNDLFEEYHIFLFASGQETQIVDFD